MKPELLVIGAGQWILDWCEHYNILYTLIQKPSLYSSSTANEVVLIDYENDPRIWDYVEALCKNRNITACIASSESALLVAEEINTRFGLPYASCDSAFFFKDKFTMRNVLAVSNLNKVAYKLVDSPLALTDFLQEHEEIVVKPRDGTGSVNVTRLSRKNTANVDHVGNYPVLAERYIGGKEYSVEAFSYQGEHYILGITEKSVDAIQLVEKQHVFPAEFHNGEEAEISRTTQEFLSLAGMKNGPSHTELKVEDGEVYIIESHNRAAGDAITGLVGLVTGINMHQQLVAWSALRIETLKQSWQSKGCAMIDFIFSEGGMIEKVHGLQSSLSLAGVVEVKLYSNAGAVIPRTDSSYNRIGHVLIHSDSRKSCEDILAKVYELLSIKIAVS
ncbi:MAG: ATP-grasp domain-containing protein [Pseudomonadales bacterium]